MDIPTFLRRYPPFDDLDDEQLAEVVRHTHIQFFPAGTIILQQGGEPSSYLYVVRTGAVETRDGAIVTDLLTEGDVFGHLSLLSGSSPSYTVRAAEDTICYLIDKKVALSVLGTRRGLAFLSSTLRRRQVRALEGTEMADVGSSSQTVGSLIRRPPVTCPLTATVREAARIMSEHGVSCLLVPHGNGVGVLTDRDLRTRVLARGRSADTIVSEVMTYPAETIRTSTTVAEAMLKMLELGIHHLPVLDERGASVGVVTETDLMESKLRAPFSVRAAIERAGSEEAVVAAARELPHAIAALVQGGADPLHVAQIVAVTHDAVTRRLLELAVARSGDPPAPWAWLALGSEARYEQGLLTDQDHALAYDTRDAPIATVDPYFAKIAERVTANLEEMGIRRCRAGVIAANREWRGSIAEWAFRFASWMSDPGRAGSAFTAIAFDFRQIAGPLDVESELHEVIRKAPQNPQFIRHLVRAATDPRPPTGFFRDLVVIAKGAATNLLDVKQAGITPITNLARAVAISAGITENRTLHRLRAAALAGRLAEDLRAGLEEAFHLLWQIRLEHQAARVASGERLDDDVDPRQLGPLTRQGLREAFRLIDHVQHALASEVGLRR